VIAALLVIVVIQRLAVRERRQKARTGQLEEGVVEMTESGGDSDSKVPQVRVRSSGEIGVDIGGKKGGLE